MNLLAHRCLVDRLILALLSHGGLGVILKLLALGAQSCCSVGKDPGSYSHKGLEASKDLATKGLGVSLHLDQGRLGHVDLVGVADGNLLLLLAASRRLESGWGRGHQEHRAQQEHQGEAEPPLETHPWGDGELMLLEACIQKNMQKKARDIC